MHIEYIKKLYVRPIPNTWKAPESDNKPGLLIRKVKNTAMWQRNEPHRLEIKKKKKLNNTMKRQFPFMTANGQPENKDIHFSPVTMFFFILWLNCGHTAGV